MFRPARTPWRTSAATSSRSSTSSSSSASRSAGSRWAAQPRCGWRPRRRSAIDRLTLACTSARFGEPEQWLERAETVRGAGIEAIADKVVARWFTDDVEPETVSRFRSLLVSTPAEGYAACCEALAGWDFRDRLGEIRAETLVLAGGEDAAAPLPDSELLAERIPRARLVVVEGAAHLANVEQPESFASAVAESVPEAA